MAAQIGLTITSKSFFNQVNHSSKSAKNASNILISSLKRSLSTASVESSGSKTSSRDDALASSPPSPAYKLYAWGTNNKGVIPVSESLEGSSSGGGGSMLSGSSTVLDEPMCIDLEKAFDIDNKSLTLKSFHCGPTSTAAILSNNTCYTFGQNKYGQLGHGTASDAIPTPTLLSPPDSCPLHYDQISQISLGSQFSAIIDTNGDLYTFGYNGSMMQEGVGCLGLGNLTTDHLSTPTLVESLIEDGVTAKQVAVGAAHMVVLTNENEVLTTGAGAYGRCGNLDPVDQLYLEPVELLASETDICQIASGKDFSMALTEKDGIVFCWGRNDKGQCGTGAGLSVEMYAMEPMPMQVEGLLEGRRVVKISAGRSHAAAITDRGELFVWGMGQALMPELLATLGHTKIVDVACGHDYTVAVGEDGEVYSFGKGKTGVLGLGKERKAVRPTMIDGMIGKKVVGVSAGWSHVACLVEEGEEK